MKQELVRRLHVDLTGDVKTALETLHLELLHVERLAKESEEPLLQYADKHSTAVQHSELRRRGNVVDIRSHGKNLGKAHSYPPFQIAGFMEGYTGSALAADGLGSRVLAVFQREGDRRICEFPFGNRFVYDGSGHVREATDDSLVGLDAFHYLTTLVEEDVALVLCEGEKLVYAADISRFEKTPKTKTGENPFLGMDLIEFHKSIPGAGPLVSEILCLTADAMADGSLHVLTVDLFGRGVYKTTGGTLVRRFERDTLVPLRENGLQGILGYADVQFQEISESRSPYQGGSPGFRPLIQTQLEAHDG